jgi:hypothetical protein
LSGNESREATPFRAAGNLAFMWMAPDVATCMYYTGIDPFTKQAVYVARDLKNRMLQRALMQFFKPENYFEVRQALIEAGRQDLIGGCEGLIPAQPPKEALDARRKSANRFRGEYYHAVPNPARKGYRPGRVSAVRQRKLGRGQPRE